MTVDLATGAGIFQFGTETLPNEFVERLREALTGFPRLGERFSVGIIPLTVDMMRGKARCVSGTIVVHTGTSPPCDC